MSDRDLQGTNAQGDPGFAPTLAVWLAGTWVLAGALFKLFNGTPADLPPSLRELPVDSELLFRSAITAELLIALLAYLKPRFGWLVLVVTLLVFDGILVHLMLQGEESCGCFGADFPVPPWAMLSIDSIFLLGILLTRPWRIRSKGAHPVLLLVLGALLAAPPWLVDLRGGGGGAGQGGETPAPRWVDLAMENWVGQDVWDTQLAEVLDVYALPLDGLWVFYRSTCPHCATHLEEMASTYDGSPLVLIRIVETGDTPENRVVNALPSGPMVVEAEIPPGTDILLTTPAELELAGGNVVRGEQGVGDH